MTTQKSTLLLLKFHQTLSLDVTRVTVFYRPFSLKQPNSHENTHLRVPVTMYVAM